MSLGFEQYFVYDTLRITNNCNLKLYLNSFHAIRYVDHKLFDLMFVLVLGQKNLNLFGVGFIFLIFVFFFVDHKLINYYVVLCKMVEHCFVLCVINFRYSWQLASERTNILLYFFVVFVDDFLIRFDAPNIFICWAYEILVHID